MPIDEPDPWSIVAVLWGETGLWSTRSESKFSPPLDLYNFGPLVAPDRYSPLEPEGIDTANRRGAFGFTSDPRTISSDSDQGDSSSSNLTVPDKRELRQEMVKLFRSYQVFEFLALSLWRLL